MKDQIKELRVQIDGLSQLVKSMSGGPKFQLDISTKPNNLEIDEWIQIFEEHNYLFVETNQGESKGLIQSSELHKCYDSLILAKAWLGKVLGELGADSPYKSGYKEVTDIEPTADTSELTADQKVLYASNNRVLVDAILTQQDWENKKHIEKVDWLREEIKSLIEKVKEIINVFICDKIYYDNVITHLTEARFWLGWELQRISESSGDNI